MINPIDSVKEREIVTLVDDYIDQAGLIFETKFKPITVLFDLYGRSAGMYKVNMGKRVIRFNPYHFAKYSEENINETIPHEVAHYISDQVYGIKNIRPHGKEWQAIMLKFGVEPKRTFSYSLEGIPTKQHKRYQYSCGCMEFSITTRRHNLILNKKAEYSCRECGKKIKLLKQDS